MFGQCWRSLQPLYTFGPTRWWLWAGSVEHPTKWKTYVANRVAEIQTTVPDARWHHVPGSDNPTDCASRGLSPGELVDHELWWRGPPWLLEKPSSWPISQASSYDVGLLEERSQTNVAIAEPSCLDEAAELVRFSSLLRLLRVTAWCRRWLSVRGVRREGIAERPMPRRGDLLTASELDGARLTWIRLVQSKNFQRELNVLKKRRPLAKSSVLTHLNLFLDAAVNSM